MRTVFIPKKIVAKSSFQELERTVYTPKDLQSVMRFITQSQSRLGQQSFHTTDKYKQLNNIIYSRFKQERYNEALVEYLKNNPLTITITELVN